MNESAASLRSRIEAMGLPEKALAQSRFFKTGEGEYAQGDCFWGVTVPQVRSVAKACKEVPLSVVEELLKDPVHECRLLALLICVARFPKADEVLRTQIYRLYLNHTRYINNWDLVDLSAYQIVGEYLRDKSREPLRRLASSSLLWEQRIAVVATWRYIREGCFDDTLRIADILLKHPHDLIQKAVGWMLREVGKRDKACLVDFLSVRYKQMPRTMLRYAIEKFPPAEKALYMKR